MSARALTANNPMPSASKKAGRQWQALILLLMVGLLLGTATIFPKLAPLYGWPPVALLLWSMLGGGLLQGVSLFLAKNRLNLSRSVIAYMTISGFLYAVPNLITYGAVQHVGAGFMALCFAFTLVVTYSFSLILKMEKPNVLRIAGVVIGLLGAVVLATDGGIFSGQINKWIFIAMSTPFIISVANIYRTLSWPDQTGSGQLSSGMMVFGALTVSIVTLSADIDVAPEVWTPGATLLLASQILIFAILYNLYFRLQKLAGPVYLSQIGSVAAVVGVFLAWLLVNEVPSIMKLAATVMIVGGVFCVSRMPKAPSSKSSMDSTDRISSSCDSIADSHRALNPVTRTTTG
ncbi:DMT family transporter [Motiliproteus sp. MSK22-1]|uniref:DMT family transporter n=1 Tax=Motiliproteus sp. MSK22-1 TaxID=1897630 RepID=UPI0013014B61|nr:DMT family transporter [Motiliproteus sp. MSK22-1]